MNYGSVGYLIGHEITHGFDDEGSQRDASGTVRDWWDSATKESFRNRTACLVRQYSSYEVPNTGGLHVKGAMTIGENMADNGGVKIAYKAYANYAGKASHNESFSAEFTPSQLFFLSFAQTWCGHMTSDAAVREVLTDTHSPLRFRINGALVNRPEFAEVFKCPVGSAMNPDEKCQVW
jgi:predicted metalloendopeptidase